MTFVGLLGHELNRVTSVRTNDNKLTLCNCQVNMLNVFEVNTEGIIISNTVSGCVLLSNVRFHKIHRKTKCDGVLLSTKLQAVGQ